MECNFSISHKNSRELIEKSRFLKSSKSQVSEEKKTSNFMEKNSLLTDQYFWRYKLLLFCFFCLLIPEIDYIMFYFTISSDLVFNKFQE